MHDSKKRLQKAPGSLISKDFFRCGLSSSQKADIPESQPDPLLVLERILWARDELRLMNWVAL
jgi:hypothetical protein